MHLENDLFEALSLGNSHPLRQVRAEKERGDSEFGQK